MAENPRPAATITHRSNLETTSTFVAAQDTLLSFVTIVVVVVVKGPGRAFPGCFDTAQQCELSEYKINDHRGAGGCADGCT